MLKRVLVAGLLGGLVLIGWTFVVNGLFGFKAAIDMKTVPGEALVYDVLKSHVDIPGRYVVNPPVVEGRGFPGGEPVYGLLYGGLGHEAAGRLMLVQTPIFFILPLIVAYLLSRADRRLLASYWRKLLFVAGIGLLLGIGKYLTDFGIASYPLSSASAHAVHELLMWSAVGLVLAWQVRAPAS